ncbi:TraM recognition domain-containing protein [Caldanaerobacter subterraneus]|uniref:TraM recognition domain-containing protein n=1 Tax=Caldanaerobacter subterraneus TaxID=911092 RepID=A0A7Y2L6X6_9THEO|nr:TraM recognition domain-containing protein [Caldanaerobacter subterraneus]
MKKLIKLDVLTVVTIIAVGFYAIIFTDLLVDVLFYHRNLYYKAIYPTYYIIVLILMPILIWSFLTGYKIKNKKLELFKISLVLSFIPMVVALSQQLYLIITPWLINLKKSMDAKTAQTELISITSSQLSSNDIIFWIRISTEVAPVLIGIGVFYILYKNLFSNIHLEANILRFNILDYLERKETNDVVLCINRRTNKPVIVKEEDRFLHMLIDGATGTGKTSSVLLKMVLQDIKRKKYWLMKVNKEIEKLINEKKVLFINPFKPKNEYLSFDDIDILPEDMDKIEDEIRADLNKCEKLYKSFIEEYFKDTSIKNAVLKVKNERKEILNQIHNLLKQLDDIKTEEERKEILNQLEVLRKKKNDLYLTELSNNYPLKVNQTLAEMLNKTYKTLLENRKKVRSDFGERVEAFNKAYEYLSKFVETYNSFTGKNVHLNGSKTLEVLTGYYKKINNIKNNIGITVVEPKGDFAEKAAQLCRANGVPYVHIDPTNNKGWAINVMQGEPEETAEIVSSVLRSMFGRQEAFFANLQEDVAKNYIKLIKYIYGNECDLMMLRKLLRDPDMLEKEVKKLKELYLQTQDMRMQDLIDYFEEEILNSKHYEDILKWTIGLRVQLDNLLSKEELVKAMSPFRNEKVLDIDKHLRNGGILLVNTALGAFGNVSSAFGKLVLLTIEYAVFRRKGDGTDTMHVFYIDEFPEYINESFKRFLTLGRSYRVSIVMAIQNLSQLIIDGSRTFLDIVKGNAATKLVFGRGEIEDIEYFSKYFGYQDEIQMDSSYTHSASIFMPHQTANKTERYSMLKKPRFDRDLIQDLPFQYVMYKTVYRGSNLPADIGRVDFVDEKEFIVSDKPLYNIVYNPIMRKLRKKSEDEFIKIIDDNTHESISRNGEEDNITSDSAINKEFPYKKENSDEKLLFDKDFE